MNINSIPKLLVISRFITAPFLLWDALDGQITIWFLIGFLAAFIGDIFDGIIARKLGVSTAELSPKFTNKFTNILTIIGK